MFCNIFFSPQGERNVIISNKHGIQKLPNELPDDLILRIFGNEEISEKSQSFTDL